MVNRAHHVGHVRWAQEFVERRWVDDRTAFDRLIVLAQSDWGAAWHDDSWLVVEDGLRRMVQLARRYQFHVIVAAFPVSVQVESRFEDDTPQRRAGQLTDRLELPFLDLLPTLRMAAGERLFYDHCHLPPLGNVLVATTLAPFVVRHLNTNPMHFSMLVVNQVIE